MVYYIFKCNVPHSNVEFSTELCKKVTHYCAEENTWENVRYLIEKKCGLLDSRFKTQDRKRELRGSYLVAYCFEDFKNNKYDLTNLTPLPESEWVGKGDGIVLVRLPSPLRVAPFIPSAYRCDIKGDESEEERIKKIIDAEFIENPTMLIGGYRKTCDIHASRVVSGDVPKPPRTYTCHQCGSPDHYKHHCPVDKYEPVKVVVPRQPLGIPSSFLKNVDPSSHSQYMINTGGRACTWVPRMSAGDSEILQPKNADVPRRSTRRNLPRSHSRSRGRATRNRGPSNHYRDRGASQNHSSPRFPRAQINKKSLSRSNNSASAGRSTILSSRSRNNAPPFRSGRARKSATRRFRENTATKDVINKNFEITLSDKSRTVTLKRQPAGRTDTDRPRKRQK